VASAWSQETKEPQTGQRNGLQHMQGEEGAICDVSGLDPCVLVTLTCVHPAQMRWRAGTGL
jgi:hypothetical protein